MEPNSSCNRNGKRRGRGHFLQDFKFSGLNLSEQLSQEGEKEGKEEVQKIRRQLSSSTRGSRRNQWNTLFQILLIAIHTFSFPQSSEAFAPPVGQTIRRGTSNSFHQKRISSFSSSPSSPASNSAATTGADADDDDNEELPWQCVVDPSSDECKTIFDSDVDGTLALKTDMRVTTTDKVSMSVFCLGSILSFYLLISLSGPGAWRFFLAGGLCAAVSHAVPTPIDVVKVRIRIENETKLNQ